MAHVRSCPKFARVTLVSFIFLVIFQSSFQTIMAARPLEGERWHRKDLVIQSLPKGNVPRSGSSTCTYIPGGERRGRCALAANEGKLSGHAGAAAAPAALGPVMADSKN